MFKKEQIDLIKTLSTSSALGVFENEIMKDVLDIVTKNQKGIVFTRQQEEMMFTSNEINFLRDCSENEIMDEIIEKMITIDNLIKNQRNHNTLFTVSEMNILKICAEDQTLEDDDRKTLSSVIYKIAMMSTAQKPQILVNINGGAVQYAIANMDIELVIVDEDLIEQDGNDLEYPCLTGNTQGEFDDQIQKEYEKVLISRAKRSSGDAVNEIRIFIYNKEDSFPFNVAINGDVIATYKTFEDAHIFLSTYLCARKQ